MKVSDLKRIEPLAEVYELDPTRVYVIVVQNPDAARQVQRALTGLVGAGSPVMVADGTEFYVGAVDVRVLYQELERLRVGFSRHRDATYSLGATNAIDEVNAFVRRARRDE